MAGKPQTLSEGQKKEVLSIFRHQAIVWLGGGSILTILSVSQIVCNAQKKMEALVARQFEEPRIQQVVQTVAAERADKVILAQVQPEVTKFKEEVASQLSEVRTVADKTKELERESQKHRDSIAGVVANIDKVDLRINDAHGRLAAIETNSLSANQNLQTLTQKLNTFDEQFQRMTEEQTFLVLANRARLYDLNAFLELDRISRTANIFAKEAGQIVWTLKRDMEMNRNDFTEYIPLESDGEEYKYKGPFTSDEIANRFSYRLGIEGCANWVRKENMKCFLPQLVHAAQSETNLLVQNRITYAISALSGREFFPWTPQSLDIWWAASSSSYTNWPYDRLDKGIKFLSQGKFSEAEKEFGAIIAFDSTAEMSRSLAILSMLTVNDTNKAVKLCSAWKHPNGRWARFSKANLMLATGDVTRATEQFASIASEFKTFTPMRAVVPDSGIYKKLDWPLYNKKLEEFNKKK